MIVSRLDAQLCYKFEKSPYFYARFEHKPCIYLDLQHIVIAATWQVLANSQRGMDQCCPVPELLTGTEAPALPSSPRTDRENPWRKITVVHRDGASLGGEACRLALQTGVRKRPAFYAQSMPNSIGCGRMRRHPTCQKITMGFLNAKVMVMSSRKGVSCKGLFAG